jgi:hypothetical protein
MGVESSASGLELTSVIGSNEAIRKLQDCKRQDLQVFIWIASFLAMTNALYANALVMMQGDEETNV